MQRWRIANRHDAKEACLTLLTQFLECRKDFAENLGDGKCVSASPLGDGIMQMEYVGFLQTKPLQAWCARRPVLPSLFPRVSVLTAQSCRCSRRLSVRVGLLPRLNHRHP